MEIRRSHRNLTERVIGLLLPMTPFRCRACQRRFWALTRPFWDLHRAVLLSIVVLLAGLLVLRVTGTWPSGVSAAESSPRPDVLGAPVLPEEAPPSQDSNPKARSLSLGHPFGKNAQKTEGQQAGSLAATSISLERDELVQGASDQEERRPQDGAGGAGAPLPSTSLERTAAELGLPSDQRKEGKRSLGPPAPTRADSRAPSKPPSQVLRRLDLQESEGALEIHFWLAGRVSDYRSFLAQRPRRFVVDLPGSWQVLVAARHKLGHHLANQVRIGKHPDKLRVVADLGLDASNDVQVQMTAKGFLIRISPAPLSPLPP